MFEAQGQEVLFDRGDACSKMTLVDSGSLLYLLPHPSVDKSGWELTKRRNSSTLRDTDDIEHSAKRSRSSNEDSRSSSESWGEGSEQVLDGVDLADWPQKTILKPS